MSSVLPFKLGDVVDGKYEVESILGVGGMAAVVAAKNVELGTPVALKCLLPVLLDDASAVARFEREARACLRLRGDHTARVHDVGKLPGGCPYLVMELLVGKDLGQLIASLGPLSVETASRYLLEACESIAEAHGLGIVHRDLKPSNLFLTTRAGGSHHIKVLDFGLARSLVSDDNRITSTTDVMGSPAYMSPEQLRSTRDAGTPSDIWSLGVCLYELLTCKLPFVGRTATDVGFQVLRVEPPSVRDVRPEVPSGLEALIRRCLEKQETSRFPDVGAFATALEPFGGPAAQGAGRRVATILETTRLMAGYDPTLPDPRTATRAPTRSTPQPRTEKKRGSGRVVGLVAALSVALAAAGFTLRACSTRPARAVGASPPPSATPRAP